MLPFYFSYSLVAALELRKNAEDLDKTAKLNCSKAVMHTLRKALLPGIPDYIIVADQDILSVSEEPDVPAGR